jgi:hypothetical protein
MLAIQAKRKATSQRAIRAILWQCPFENAPNLHAGDKYIQVAQMLVVSQPPTSHSEETPGSHFHFQIRPKLINSLNL